VKKLAAPLSLAMTRPSLAEPNIEGDGDGAGTVVDASMRSEKSIIDLWLARWLPLLSRLVVLNRMQRDGEMEARTGEILTASLMTMERILKMMLTAG
jgi:hypothetical protein